MQTPRFLQKRYFLIATFLIVASACAGQVGFQTVTIETGGAQLEAGIWYPTETASSQHRLGPYTQEVAVDAPLAGRALPLVLISHGSGGWFGGHYDTATSLAKAGFIVAALTHRGDDSGDESRRAEVWIRPPQVQSLITYMLDQWSGRSAIDADRVGVFGFSAGGFTALVLAGGTPTLSRVLAYCKSHPTTETCRVTNGSSDDFRKRAVSMPASVWVHDERIRAVVAAAPALGFAFGREGLQNVRIPVQIWLAAQDQVLPSPDYAEAVKASLPLVPDFQVVPNAGHYDFMAPCPAKLAKEVPAICAELDGFDRTVFHVRFNEKVVTFFLRTLAKNSGGPG